ncbi:hypothetical protein HAHE_39480 [Haloferula helveola]|uniref:Type IV pilus assembly protein PilO n=1 Tax=Haloferula helveola TaxID=490095 RepID=A0ABN6H8S2_9BACT|nr:hypothetical protein HAHE_39480 [Haloferula helveola]
MKPREKRLLIAFAVILFAMVNFYGYKVYTEKKAKVAKDITTKELELRVALGNLDERDSKQKEIDWLNRTTPDPMEGGAAQSQLESFVSSRARSSGLTVDRPKILPNDERGEFYHRAIFQINVSGKEDALYRWLVQLHSPKDFRAITGLQLKPNREDDTLIDAEVQIEQWYLPVSSDNPDAEPTI